MTLKDKIFDLCNKLAQNGWREVVLSVSKNQLDIQQNSAEELIVELYKPLTNGINRNIKGFVDFRLDGHNGITPFSFSKSLFYHAIASPKVNDSSITYYPSLEELDIVENLIYSIMDNEQSNKRSLDNLKTLYGSKLVVAVFAYQYRAWEGSSHRIHADMNYSRAGISRVGTSDSIYDHKRRSFWVGDTDGEVSVLPCRYGAFLAIKDTGNALSDEYTIMDSKKSDNNLEFIVPIHKLFSGSECLSDLPNLTLDFETYHKNEKLAKSHNTDIANTIPISGYNLTEFPFLIDDQTKSEFLYSTDILPGSILIKPTKGSITEPAIQNGKYAAFNVPRSDQTIAGGRGNRFNTSFQIPAGRNGRKAPEYVNIRHMIKDLNVIKPEEDIQNINELPLDDFENFLNKGEFLAVDFIDRTGDGFVNMKGLEGLQVFAAYSLITALDFFPLVDQRDIYRWDKSDSIDHFRQGNPAPLSNGRISANINLKPFMSDQTLTHTAVISEKPALQKEVNLKIEDIPAVSFLSDGASNVFAPGWDISMDSENGVPFSAAYGLGSPFPEDAKLCAALNSFWPAAAPDASRTFFSSLTSGGFSKQLTAIPLTDRELGIYPRHADSLDTISNMGWDGEYGPFLETIDAEEFVNYADIARSDYTFNAWKGFMNMDLLKKITTSKLIDRMEALQTCILELLPPANDEITKNGLWLVSFREISDWGEEKERIDNKLLGHGYQFIFIVPSTNEVPIVDSTDIKRLRMRVGKKFECQLDSDTFIWRDHTLTNTFALNRSIPKVNFISQMK